MSVTEDTSHPPMSRLNSLAYWNIDRASVTEDVPSSDVLVEQFGVAEHAVHVGHGGHVHPDVPVELFCAVEHPFMSVTEDTSQPVMSPVKLTSL